MKPNPPIKGHVLIGEGNNGYRLVWSDSLDNESKNHMGGVSVELDRMNFLAVTDL